MAKKSTTKAKPKRGKQHPVHAESLQEIGKAILELPPNFQVGDLSMIFYREADRIRSIVR